MLHTVVVTYNAESYLEPCLASLAHAGRVIVVDNASTDRTVEVIQRFPDYELIRSEKNLGYAGGTNLGLARALAEGADHVLILDQDARLFPDTADKLVAFAEAHPDYGVVSPLHLTPDERSLDIHFRTCLLKKDIGIFDHFLLGHSQPQRCEISRVNSAIWLITRKCLKTVGGFDPIYFQYSADMDYCFRVHYHGMKVGILFTASAVHARLKQLPPEEEKALTQRSPQRLSSFELAEIKKPTVSLYREFFHTNFRLLAEAFWDCAHFNFRGTWTKLLVCRTLLTKLPAMKIHQKTCRETGTHWLDVDAAN